jgi:hypothetical protein
VPARRELGASLALARDLAQGLPLEVVDELPRMQKQHDADGRTPADLYFRHDAHLNAYGNQVFGKALADTVAWPGATSAWIR